MGVFSSSSGSFGAGVFTGSGLGGDLRRKKRLKGSSAGNLDGSVKQSDDHNERFFDPK